MRRSLASTTTGGYPPLTSAKCPHVLLVLFLTFLPPSHLGLCGATFIPLLHPLLS